jgi:hypothetical protein
MARPGKGGWDFIKVGGTYQYYETGWVAMVTVMKDLSTPEQYAFRVRVDKSDRDLGSVTRSPQFTVSHTREDMMYSGMSQFFETEMYEREYVWIRKED